MRVCSDITFGFKVAVQSGVLDRQTLITMHGSTPRGSFLGRIIIDDLILIEKVNINADNALVSEEKRRSMHNMYKKVGLEAHPSKGFSNESIASIRGADIDGISRLIRGSITRAMWLCWIAQQVATLCCCKVPAPNFILTAAGKQGQTRRAGAEMSGNNMYM